MPLLDLPYHSGPREILGPHVYFKMKVWKILNKNYPKSLHGVHNLLIKRRYN
ncbi:MAG: hypothetical protein XD49_1697 [Caldanaerobacter subterraneus]|jgi:hypothetical protein|nr:MAG: hypothetical protein XD49_1697 [Caldanaerobacter subterraneus]MDI3518563.1 hypothetical protein [Caldanaerobacter sp.]